MATEDLYSTDSYLRTFEAVVQRAGPDGVVLDRTAFYPRGGGQPGDSGELRAGTEVWPVTRVQRRAGDIAHAVEGEPPEPGTPVTGSLDWERRFRFMRLHTALHALSGIVWTGWNADVTGSNISTTASARAWTSPWRASASTRSSRRSRTSSTRRWPPGAR